MGRVNKIPSIVADLKSAILNSLHELGSKGVEYAVKNHEFQNRTFNLEDSYGYAVYENGIIIGSPIMFGKKATKPNGGKFGYSEGEKFLIEQSPSGIYSLVVVAGMYYAEDVQFYYGLDVIEGSFLRVKSVTELVWNKWK